jgi:ABC-type branched-subunit amino acid transport system ATPase component
MEKDLTELINILNAEYEVFVRYLERLTEQQQYLIENNLDGITISLEKINTLAQYAVNLETGRRRIIESLSERLAMNPEDITIGKLIENFKGPNFEELEGLKNTILDIYIKVNRQKKRNELLIEQSMGIIKQTMNYIHQTNNPKVIYDNPVAPPRGAVDRGSFLTRMG